jgi:Predicted dehydrogenases and related proteins
VRPVPVGVIGAGAMGMNHLRVYDALPEAALVEVVEPDPDRAAAVAAAYDVAVHDTVAALETAEAVTVAVPNAQHRHVAVVCLERGMDVLVEKPLATSVADAEAIVAAARDADRILQVGHIERFNPAVEVLTALVDELEVFAVEAHRLGPFNEHLSSESVIHDLMIHDLDIITALIPEPIDTVSAMGIARRSDQLDHAVASLQFASGIIAQLTASHVTHGKVRTLTLTAKDAYVTLDYQDQRLTIHRRGLEETTTVEDRPGYRTETVTETPYVQTGEPLQRELTHFLACVEARRKPRVDGEQSIETVRLATEVIESMNS